MKALAALLLAALAAAGIQGSQGRTRHHLLPHPGSLVSPAVGPRTSNADTSYHRSDSLETPRIVGGTVAEKHEFPWIASLGRKMTHGEFFYHCAASILDEQWLVTAAYCVYFPAIYIIVAGEHDLTQQEDAEQRRNVEFIFSYPGFCHIMKNNIALVKLAEPLKLDGKTVSPIALPAPHANATGECVVMGWGRTGSCDFSDVLRKIVVPIVTDERCREIYEEEEIPDSYICAGYSEGDKNFNKGDSGGSLVCQDEDGKQFLAGIASWNYGICDLNYPGLYTEVSYYIDWIKATTQGE